MTETTETSSEAAEAVVEEVVEEAATEEGDAAEDSSSESDAADETAAEEEAEVTEDDADEEPPVRKPKTNADWVAKRRGEKLKKEKAAEDDQQGEADESDEDDVDDEDAKLIDSRIARQLAPLQAKEYTQEVKAEIDTFVSENPDFKPFAAKAAKWAEHPDYKNLPTKQLMYAAAGDKMLIMGAQRKAAAITKANKTKTGSNSGGEAGGTKPVAEMSDEEFNAEVMRVKTQPKN
jgi:hypothetical protein